LLRGEILLETKSNKNDSEKLRDILNVENAVSADMINRNIFWEILFLQTIRKLKETQFSRATSLIISYLSFLPYNCYTFLNFDTFFADVSVNGIGGQWSWIAMGRNVLRILLLLCCMLQPHVGQCKSCCITYINLLLNKI